MTMGSFKFQVMQGTFTCLCVPLTQRFSNFRGSCHALGMLLVSESGKMRKSFFSSRVCKQKLRNMFAFGLDDLNQQSSTFSLGAGAV